MLLFDRNPRACYDSQSINGEDENMCAEQETMETPEGSEAELNERSETQEFLYELLSEMRL